MPVVLMTVPPLLEDSAANSPPYRYMRRLTSCRTPWHSTYTPAPLEKAASLLEGMCVSPSGALCDTHSLLKHGNFVRIPGTG
jgi:hypothetical protein